MMVKKKEIVGGGGKENPFSNLATSGASTIRCTNHIEIPAGETHKFDFNFAETFQKDEFFQKWRGHIINNALFIEEKMEYIISKIFFKKNRENINQFHSIILCKDFFTFMNKWFVLRDALNFISPYKERNYTRLKTNLKEIINIRNKFAHGQVSYFGNKSEKIILEYFSGETKREEITENTINNFIELVKKCHQELDKIIGEIEKDFKLSLSKRKGVDND